MNEYHYRKLNIPSRASFQIFFISISLEIAFYAKHYKFILPFTPLTTKRLNNLREKSSVSSKKFVIVSGVSYYVCVVFCYQEYFWGVLASAVLWEHKTFLWWRKRKNGADLCYQFFVILAESFSAYICIYVARIELLLWFTDNRLREGVQSWWAWVDALLPWVSFALHFSPGLHHPSHRKKFTFIFHQQSDLDFCYVL